jgi:hypothetical protein
MAMTHKNAGGGLFVGYDSLNNLAANNQTYTDVGTINTQFYRTKTFEFFASANNNLLVNILGSINGGNNFNITVEADLAVNANTTVQRTYIPAGNNVHLCTHMKVQCKCASANQTGTLSTRFMGATY